MKICAGLFRGICEDGAALVREDLRPHFPRLADVTEVVDVPVGDEQVEPAVEIEVDGLRAEPQELASQRVEPCGARVAGRS